MAAAVDAKAPSAASNALSSSANKPFDRPGLTRDEQIELKEAFDLFDVEGTGRIEASELKGAMQALGYNKKNKLVFGLIDQLKDGPIDFNAFLDLMTAKVSDSDSEADLLKVFELFDDDGKGAITLQSLSRIAKELGENMTTLELKEMIERADEDQDGVISKKEFIALMTKKQAE